MSPDPVTLLATEAAVVATESRTVSGMLVPYGAPGRTNLGQLTVRAGALELPAPTGRLRLLYGHDRERPVGVAASLTETAEGLVGTFTIARTPAGDAYMAELDPAAPIRDGLSVELEEIELDGSEIVAGRLVACAAVPLPAYPTARAALAAEESAPPEEGTPDMTETTEAAAPQVTASEELARPATPAAYSPARTAPVDALRLLASRISEAKMHGTAPQLLAALADITPAGNVGSEDAALGVQALGQLWDGVGFTPTYRDKIRQGELTGMTVHGWAWDVPPEVDDYTGNKAEVPSNAATLKSVSVDAARLAGAHDIDRVYVDLGAPEFMVSYWEKMAESLAYKLDKRAEAAIIAAGGVAITTAATPLAARLDGALALAGKLGGATFCFMAKDMVQLIAETPASDAPIGDPIALPPITPAPELTAGTVIVGNRNAVRQHVINPAIRVQAVNVPNGGIDPGLFSYSAELADEADAVRLYTVTPVAAGAGGRGRNRD